MMQKMSRVNRIKNVAIVGATGNIGAHITSSLLSSANNFTITALTRNNTNADAAFPAGIAVKQISYDDPDSIVEALKGQDALVITLGGRADADAQMRLIRAADEAGVRFVIPNEWGPDTGNVELVRDIPVFGSKEWDVVQVRKDTEQLKRVCYIAICTGYWYEWSLAKPDAFGINFEKKSVTFYDEGDVKACTTTWPQLARAVAALLSLPIQSETDQVPKPNCLDDLRNELVYVNSFNISQRDMFASALRVTGTTEEDWSITKQPSRERYDLGVKEIEEGKWTGYAKMAHSRLFFQDGCGDFESKGTLNARLDLPVEDIDEATEAAIERIGVGQ